MYKFAAVTMASFGIFFVGLVSGATLAAISFVYKPEDKTDEERKDDLDAAYENVMNLINNK